MVDDETGEESTLTFNVDIIDYQVMNFIQRVHADQPHTALVSHGFRWTMINGFIRDHRERLLAEGLARHGEDPDAVEISSALIDVLAVEPYELRERDVDGEWTWKFDPDRVIEKAKRVQEKDE